MQFYKRVLSGALVVVEAVGAGALFSTQPSW